MTNEMLTSLLTMFAAVVVASLSVAACAKKKVAHTADPSSYPQTTRNSSSTGQDTVPSTSSNPDEIKESKPQPDTPKKKVDLPVKNRPAKRPEKKQPPSDINPNLPNIDETISTKRASYKVVSFLGKGGYGAVFAIERESDGEVFAAKCELLSIKKKVLDMDCKVLQEARKAGSVHFCKIEDRGQDPQGRFRFIITTLIGQNLWDLQHNKDKKSGLTDRFSRGTAVRVAKQTLEAIEQLHKLKFIHRDIKPGNFAIGRGSSEEERTIYMLDFGLCRAYATDEKPFRRKRVSAPFRGTSRYAPRTAFKNDEMARKDDLETWLYMIIEQMTGKLPWGHIDKNDKAKLLQMKEKAFNSDANIAALTKNCPKEYAVLAKYINTLEYTDIPDYSYMYAMLDRAMNKIGVTDDEPYDWELETEFFGPSEPYSHLEDSDE